MSGRRGLDTLKRILHRKPQIRILMFSMHDDCIYAKRAIQAGARGYMPKTESPEVVLEAVQKIVKSNHVMNYEMAHHPSIYHLAHQENPMQRLSAPEFAIFAVRFGIIKGL